jgi:dTMP kinase
LNFHERVRRGYLAIARQDPHRVKVVRADRPVGEVQAEIRNLVDDFLARRGRTGGDSGFVVRGSGRKIS